MSFHTLGTDSNSVWAEEQLVRRRVYLIFLMNTINVATKLCSAAAPKQRVWLDTPTLFDLEPCCLHARNHQTEEWAEATESMKVITPGSTLFLTACFCMLSNVGPAPAMSVASALGSAAEAGAWTSALGLVAFAGGGWTRGRLSRPPQKWPSQVQKSRRPLQRASQVQKQRAPQGQAPRLRACRSKLSKTRYYQILCVMFARSTP